MSQLIPDIVDEVLFKLLHALDNGDMPLAWRRENGTYVDLYDLGRSEMAGWIVTKLADFVAEVGEEIGEGR